MLRPLKVENQGKVTTYYCHHWRVFPPVSAMLDLDVEEQRVRKMITTQAYEQHKVWKRICGLAEGMVEGVCLQCPHVRRLVHQVGHGNPPVLESLDGKHRFPVVDAVDIASRGGSRGSLETHLRKSRGKE